MIQLIRFMRDAEDFNTGGGMEQTPIEKAIDLINANKNQAEHLTSFEVHNAFYNMLQSLLPYEKKRDRNIAEKAWDRCWDEGNSWDQDNEISKQTYLKQNHPL